jgi:large subunit ribosomal protein L6
MLAAKCFAKFSNLKGKIDMSRVGKLPIIVPSGVTVTLEKNNVSVAGKNGTLNTTYSDKVLVVLEDNKIVVSPKLKDATSRAMWGLYRNLINNMVKGVDAGFITRLEINGVGYRASIIGRILTLALGYSHDIKMLLPEGIKVVCEKPTLLVVSGHDKQLLGQFCAQIIKQRPTEPYKGKGIKIEGKRIIRKVGKKK